MLRAPGKAGAFVAGTIALGGAALAIAGVEAASAPTSTLALFCAAVALTELFQVSNDETSLDPADAHLFSFSSGVHLAAVLVMGPWAGALVAAWGVIAVDRFRGGSLRQIGFNASGFALASIAGGYAFEAFGGHVGTLALPSGLPAFLALAVAYTATNTLLVSLAVALTTETRVWPVLRDSFRPELGTAAGEVGLGIALADFALEEPWFSIALVPLMFAVYQAHARLAQLRRETARALETFANIVDERDPYTYRHSDRVAEYVQELARSIGLPAGDVARLRWAGRLHDLGKVAVDTTVLHKRGRLENSEWAAIRRHPRLSARLLQRFRFAAELARAVEYHHERFDGSGYYGIDPRELPLTSHFLIVADSFDAMTTDRPYREGLPREEALAEIERNSGTQFHPAVAKAFVALQRGIDPLAVLGPEELSKLRGTLRRRRLPAPADVFALAERPELLAFAGVVTGLVGAGLGQLELGLAGAALACAGLALRAASRHRATRLTASLRRLIHAWDVRERAFRALADQLERACGVTWAGLVDWQEQDLDGTLELEHGKNGPTEAALTSWLVREAESGKELIVAAGYELGRQCVHVALPLRRDGGALVGFLALASPRRLPRHAERALAACLAELGRALAAPPGGLDAEGAPVLAAVR